MVAEAFEAIQTIVTKSLQAMAKVIQAVAKLLLAIAKVFSIV